MENWPPYKWLWTRTTQKPFTWCVRDFTRDKVGVVLICAACTGWIVGVYFKRYWLPLLIGFIVGLLFGHFYW